MFYGKKPFVCIMTKPTGLDVLIGVFLGRNL